MTHYYLQLPFLHQSILLEHTTQATKPSPSRSKISRAVLLAFHALTAPLLVSDSHSVTPEEYVDAARREIDAANSAASLDTIQVLLMVGYYEWIIQDDPCGIESIRRAIEQAKDFGYHDDQNEIIDNKNSKNAFSDSFIHSETRRRTVWGCFIMDSFIFCMANCPRSLSTSELQLQLPCTERALLLGREIKTRLIQEDDETYDKRIAGTPESTFEVEEGEVSLFIRLMVFYTEILNFSTTQERRCV
jgi:hypothetical protein